ncbi:hypothetical protein B932_0187 [Gluconobacter oxydans H24]|nr:hypothetical protein B932_0187 [Gluconobacter oxydans H24]
MCHAELLFEVHGETGGLFTVTQRRIENDNAVVGNRTEGRMLESHVLIISLVRKISGLSSPERNGTLPA